MTEQTTPRSLLSAEKVRVGMTVMITDFTGMAFEREVVPENVESIKRATRAQNWSVTLLSDAPTEGRGNIVMHASKTGHTVMINAGRCADCDFTEADAPTEDRESYTCSCGRAWEGHYNPHAITCVDHWRPRAERAEAKLAEVRELVVQAWPDPFGNWTAEQAAAARAMKERVLRIVDRRDA